MLSRILLTLLLTLSVALADTRPEPDEIAYLLNAQETPAGVVFEVVESDEDALNWALPRIQRYVQRLRARYPDLDIAVVTHGSEEFALQSKYREQYREAHEAVEQLSSEAGVDVHVCEAHAGWYGVTAEDFPAYVDVAPAGPVQIRQYEELGWELVRVTEE